MAGINVAQTASVGTPAASTATIYVDTTASPLLKYIDPAAAVHTSVDDISAQTITGVKTMSGLNNVLVNSSGLTIRNPGNTFKYTVTGAAIAADRVLTLPLTTGADTLASLGLAQTWSAIQTFTTPVIGAATGTSVVLTGAITSNGTAGIGYATGAGGAITQLTDKTTAFTLSKICGTIQFAATALAADTSVSSTWTNTTIAANDLVVFTHKSGGTLGAYTVACTPGAGTVVLHNCTPGSLSEAPVFMFAVIKAVVA